MPNGSLTGVKTFVLTADSIDRVDLHVDGGTYSAGFASASGDELRIAAFSQPTMVVSFTYDGGFWAFDGNDGGAVAVDLAIDAGFTISDVAELTARPVSTLWQGCMLVASSRGLLEAELPGHQLPCEGLAGGLRSASQ